METEAEKREADILRTLRGRYEQRGYTFIPHPTADLVPSFLRGYRPDAIAVSDKGSIVIEVKAAKTPAAQKSLQQIARLVADRPDWKLEIYYAGDFPRAAYQRPSPDEVSRLVEEVHSLIGAGFLRAAVVMGWAAIEAIVRGLRAGSESASAPMMPSASVEWLVSSGHLDPAAGRALRQMIRLRNAIVHGDQKLNMTGNETDVLVNALEGLARLYEENFAENIALDQDVSDTPRFP
ncbi:hypothetical protein [Bradyrhizobium daqingense]|uniref:hypothetical protein n=1 Tax=Bradyrhizobium daqingense TaxID=993502 RepID=UPI00384B32F0